MLMSAPSFRFPDNDTPQQTDNFSIDPALFPESAHQKSASVAAPSQSVATAVPKAEAPLLPSRQPASGPARTSKGQGQVSNEKSTKKLYYSLNVPALKSLCRERNFKVGGKKGELVERLEKHDQQCLPKPRIPSSNESQQTERETPSLSAAGAVVAGMDQTVDVAKAMQESFNHGFENTDDGPGEESNDEDDHGDDEGDDGPREDSMEIDTLGTESSKAWIDAYIMDTRRKSGQQTEKSVLSLWRRWVPIAIAAGTIPDHIVDANHTMEYLKYAATRSLFTTRGHPKEGPARLSSSSLKKNMTMLGRVRQRQCDNDPTLQARRPTSTSRSQDFYKALMVESQRLRLEDEFFDISENTILDSQLHAVHFEEITSAIFTKLDQLPSVIKAHFSWTW
ncbi:uncharacterized protein LACBIDRAFT_302766 [Laccaria bicolor S238N-H82]|uniref:Predicted protein n=1 Tax=Laccaria bicolor (strain S238N-H82 / ATCC MYA-4686) TaxID=486041 RepID=B0DI91_LACBS|nr:uncharacterized protein LACBIDRAFT_302766 [Laccaria bicolor S238N-H82]EDR05640.1 predicted protein [Laccaria bicolor S238N-H82]|eukprot:XP_001883744.1 predicted protein [Laccaria bicolor S238N-H82]